MIVYVESNFILERAFLREEHEACDALIDLARSGVVRLLLPAFSLGEPYEAWVRRSRLRAGLHRQLLVEVSELARSRPYASRSDRLRETAKLLQESALEERERLDQALLDAANAAEVIPTDAEVIHSALTVQRDLGLSPQDSIVYASILAHLAASAPGPKCFITRNSKDFLRAALHTPLAEAGCRLMWSFVDGLGFVRAAESSDPHR